MTEADRSAMSDIPRMVWERGTAGRIWIRSTGGTHGACSAHSSKMLGCGINGGLHLHLNTTEGPQSSCAAIVRLILDHAPDLMSQITRVDVKHSPARKLGKPLKNVCVWNPGGCSSAVAVQGLHP